MQANSASSRSSASSRLPDAAEVPSNLPSIRQKLRILIVLSMGLALALSCIISGWSAAESSLRTKRESLFGTAQIFAAAVSAATERGDSQLVEQGLRGISRIRGLTRAEVTGMNGAVLGELGEAVRLSTDPELAGSAVQDSLLQLLSSRTLKVSTDVVNGARVVGRLTLFADISDIFDSVISSVFFAILASVAAFVPAVLLAQRLARSVARPLMHLEEAMRTVTETGRYEQVSIDSGYRETARVAATYNVMIGEISRATEQILRRESEIIERLSRAGEMRDDQTGQHVIRVAKISRIIAEGIGLDEAYINDLCRASPMHDVGKISIPDAILHKPGRLDPTERNEMEKHAFRGFEILSGSESELVKLAAEIALSHHERWDGAGYPRQLSGPAIPISGRITAVADVCDALLSERPYKQPWSLDEVRSHLIENAGTHFDPACVDALVAAWADLATVYREQEASPDLPSAH